MFLGVLLSADCELFSADLEIRDAFDRNCSPILEIGAILVASHQIGENQLVGFRIVGFLRPSWMLAFTAIVVAWR